MWDFCALKTKQGVASAVFRKNHGNKTSDVTMSTT